MQNSQQAIATLQAFVNTQQPLIDVLNDAIAYLQGQYDASIQSGDLKTLNDQVTTLTAQVTDTQSRLTDAQSQLDNANSQLSDLTDQVNYATTIDDLTALQTSLSANRITPPVTLTAAGIK